MNGLRCWPEESRESRRLAVFHGPHRQLMGRDMALAAFIEEGGFAETVGKAVTGGAFGQGAMAAFMTGHAGAEGVTGGVGPDKVEGLTVARRTAAVGHGEAENHRHGQVRIVAFAAGRPSRVFRVRFMTVPAGRQQAMGLVTFGAGHPGVQTRSPVYKGNSRRVALPTGVRAVVGHDNPEGSVAFPVTGRAGITGEMGTAVMTGPAPGNDGPAPGRVTVVTGRAADVTVGRSGLFHVRHLNVMTFDAVPVIKGRSRGRGKESRRDDREGRHRGAQEPQVEKADARRCCRAGVPTV